MYYYSPAYAGGLLGDNPFIQGLQKANDSLLTNAETWLRQFAPIATIVGMLGVYISSKTDNNVIRVPGMLISGALALFGGYYVVSNAFPSLRLPALAGGLNSAVQGAIYPTANAPPVSTRQLVAPVLGVSPVVDLAKANYSQPDIILPRQVITGKSVLGSRNPIDDSNHIYAGMAEVY